MKQGMSYSCKEKTIILNVFKYFRMHFPDKCVTEIVRRTAKATGCSEKSIFQFRKEEASAEGFKEPSKTKIRKNININSRDVKYGNDVRQAIRFIIYDLKYRNIVPSLNTILKQINENPHLPNFSLMTLRRLLFDMGFVYEKNGNKAVLVDKSDAKESKEQPQQKSGSSNKKSVQNYPSSMPSTTNDIAPAPNTNNIPTQVTMTTVNNLPPMNQNMHPPPLREQQPPRFMHMHMAQPEGHMMPPSMHAGHAMPVMLNNPRRDLMHPSNHGIHPSAMDMHLKMDIPPWIHHPHNTMKEQ